MKKLFLMLAVLFIALCLFVSCDDSSDKEAVSTWRKTMIKDIDPYYDVDNFELVLYDDGTFKFINSYIYKISGEVVEKGSTSREGTYTFTSDTAGTFTFVTGSDTSTGSFTIEGIEMSISIQEGSNIVYIELDKV